MCKINDSKLKVAIVVENINLNGGLEIVSRRLCDAFKNRKIDSEIYSLYNSSSRLNLNESMGTLLMKVKENNINHVIVQLSNPLCKIANINFIRKLNKYAIVDVVLHNSPRYFLKRYYLWGDNKLIFVLKVIKTYLINNPKMYFSLQKMIKAGCKVITLSNGNKNELQKYLGIKSQVIPNYYIPNNEIVNLREKTHEMLFVGRMDIRQKNLFFLLSAWNLVDDKKKWNLKIIGKGNKTELVKYINKNNIENVILCDELEQNEIIKEMNKSSVFLLASKYEGFPTVLIEAASLGNAIITTKYDGFSDEIVKNNLNGYVVEFNKKKYSEKIQYLIDDKDLLAEMQNKSIDLFCEYNRLNVIDMWLELWNNK